MSEYATETHPRELTLRGRLLIWPSRPSTGSCSSLTKSARACESSVRSA
jgi:hypothetical protein